jgi:dTMP kinase
MLKGTLDLDWCMSPDIGLPQPDQVIFLNLSESEAAGRGDFGRERYEQTEFQRKVKEIFFQLKDKDSSYWTVRWILIRRIET